VNHYICIHGHFYQPPRENPWLEEIELQDAAYPYHDWNERITEECYAPNTASRILGDRRRIIDITNNYARMSFNFAPTLLSWMQRHSPEVYQAIIEADRLSRERFSGHGSAMAQVYNHMIMPLANARDKYTQVFWGIRDFEDRFGRRPEGMWLPETAVDLETLEVLAAQGIAFTILAPHQAKRVRKIEDPGWKAVGDGGVNPTMPYLCTLPSGKAIVLFFYDGPISHDLAFGDLLRSGENLASRLFGAFPDRADRPSLVHIATDGESYGHHHRFGDMALAYALHSIEDSDRAVLTNYGEYLELYPPTHEVEIFENTSWSCAHGVERWRADCGCRIGTRPGWTQQWRKPLREAMDWLHDELAQLYEREAASYLHDPWEARDRYIEVILHRSPDTIESFLSKHALRELSEGETVTVLKLLELQRHTMLMFTSCGWFFDEISGIETVQIMQYASRALQLAKEASGANFEPGFLTILERAPSNVTQFRNGVDVWEAYVKPATIDLLRFGAHYAVSSLFEEYPETAQIYCNVVKNELYDQEGLGIQRLALGKATIRSDITWEEAAISFAVLHLGDHNLLGGVRGYMGDDGFSAMSQEIKDAFTKSDIPEVIRVMDKHFETHNYSLWHLFKDEQRKVLNQILDATLEEIEFSFRQIYEHHYPVMQVMRGMHIPLPKALATTLEFVLNRELRGLLEDEELDLERLQELVGEVTSWSLEPDKTTIGFVATKKIDSLMTILSQSPEDLSLLETIEALLRISTSLPLELDLWKTQNIYFALGKEHYPGKRAQAEGGDQAAAHWVEHFDKVGGYLHVYVNAS
jgi:alpha-amylase/alpha-mannosidase (GH57 family)